jgi:hypothetical protein
MRIFQIEVIFEDYSESYFFRRRKEANQLFEKFKNDFKQNEDIKKITLNLYSLQSGFREPLEQIERRTDENNHNHK